MDETLTSDIFWTWCCFEPQQLLRQTSSFHACIFWKENRGFVLTVSVCSTKIENWHSVLHNWIEINFLDLVGIYTYSCPSLLSKTCSHKATKQLLLISCTEVPHMLREARAAAIRHTSTRITMISEVGRNFLWRTSFLIFKCNKKVRNAWQIAPALAIPPLQHCNCNALGAVE